MILNPYLNEQDCLLKLGSWSRFFPSAENTIRLFNLLWEAALHLYSIQQPGMESFDEKMIMIMNQYT